MHEILVNSLGGLSLPRKSVVRLTGCPNMTLAVYSRRKTTTQQQLGIGKIASGKAQNTSTAVLEFIIILKVVPETPSKHGVATSWAVSPFCFSSVSWILLKKDLIIPFGRPHMQSQTLYVKPCCTQKGQNCIQFWPF